jgi:hypothetical protein
VELIVEVPAGLELVSHRDQAPLVMVTEVRWDLATSQAGQFQDRSDVMTGGTADGWLPPGGYDKGLREALDRVPL